MSNQQILTGAIELLSNKGLERRIQRLESQNLSLLWMLRKTLEIINEIDCETDISPLIEDFENYLDRYPLQLP